MTLLMGLAVLPTLVLLFFMYKMDSYEKEPAGLLISLFLLGVASIIPAVILEVLGDAVLLVIFDEDEIIYHFLEAFFGVALVEEGCKFFCMWIRTWWSKSFNYKFDGMVYAVFVSLGFATLENIMYVFDGGMGTAVVRALLSVPGHMIDAVFMGYFYGIAKDYSARGNTGKCLYNLAMSIIVAVILHGTYDFCLFVGSVPSILFFLVFVVVIDILGIIRIVRSSKRNAKIYEKVRYIYCTECGNQCDYHTFFCGRCGASLHRVEAYNEKTNI